MSRVVINSEKIIGKIKPMNCVNNGPIVSRKGQCRGNNDLYKNLYIPYARNYDASFCANYG